MKKVSPRSTERKRGLGRGLEVLLTDTPAMNGLPPAPEPAIATNTRPTEVLESGALANARLQLLQEAEALRTLMLEFELIIRADLHEE